MTRFLNFGRRVGAERNLAAEAISEQVARRRETENVWTEEPAVVVSYSFQRKRAVVRLKLHPNRQPYVEVPVIGVDEWHPLQPGDVGILHFFSTDALGAFDDGEVQQRSTHRRHVVTAPVFEPRRPMLEIEKSDEPAAKDATATVSDVSKFGPSDYARATPLRGGILIEKSDGSITFLAYEDLRVIPQAGASLRVGEPTDATAPLRGILHATAAYDPSSIGAESSTSTTVTVTGAEVGDIAVANFPDVAGIVLTAVVESLDTVRVRFSNITSGSVNPGSGTLRVMVWKVT